MFKKLLPLIVVFTLVINATAITYLPAFAGAPQTRAQSAPLSDRDLQQNNRPAAIGALVTATKSVDKATANPGDTLNYTVIITDSGLDATNVQLTDILSSSLTLVGGSLAASPVAVNDTYPQTVIGNVPITSSLISFSVTSNDFLGLNPTATISAYDATSANGGNVVVNADGTFTYNPPPGYEGADSFTYTLTDNANANSAAANRTATVSLTVSGMVWFIDNNATACTTLAAGCGRLSNPFSTLAAFNGLNNGAGNNPAANDNIFIYESASSYSGGVTLLSGQKLIGQDSTSTLATITGLTTPSSSATFPAMNTGGNATTIVNAAGNGVALNSGNTLNGFTGGVATGIVITGTNFGTLTVADVIVNTTGQALNLTNGTLAATFTSVTSSGGTNNIALAKGAGVLAGTLTMSAGALSAATGNAFDVNGGTATISYAGTIDNTAARSVNIANMTGGTTTFSGAVSGSGTGINLATNGGATINFTGGINLSTGANAAFTATGGGTVNATQNNTSIVNTLTTSTGTALNVANTTIGASGLTFRSISSNGATNGIILNTTGATAGLTVSGNGGSCTSVGTCTGGTIQSASVGVLLNSTTSVSIDRMFVSNSQHSGINGVLVTNFSFTNGKIDNSGTLLGAGDSNIAFNTGEFSGSTGVNKNIAGTLTITGNTLTNAYYSGLDVYQFDGTISDANISNNILTSATSTASSKSTAILLQCLGSASTVSSITKGTINLNTITNFPSNAGIFVSGGNSTSSSAPVGTYGADALTNIIAINNNTIVGQSSPNQMGTQGIAVVLNGRGTGNFIASTNGITNVKGNAIQVSAFGLTTLNMFVIGNRINAHNLVASQGVGAGTGNSFATSDTPTLNLKVGDGTAAGANNISNTDGNGILIVARSATGHVNARVLTNTVGTPIDSPPSGTTYGIRVDAGNAPSVDDAVCLEIAGNTTSGDNDGFGTIAPGIGLRKQGTTSTTNDFGIVGMAATSSPNVENYVNGLNPGSASGTFGTGGTVLISASSGFSNCSEPAVLAMLPNSNRSIVQNQIETNPIVLAQAPSTGVNPLSAFNTPSGSANLFKQTAALTRNANSIQSIKFASNSVAEARQEQSANRLNKPATINLPSSRLQSGETVSVGPISTLPAGKSVTIKFQATIANPFTIGSSVTNHGTVSGGNFTTVQTNNATTTINLPDLVAVKTNNVGGSTTLGSSWTWTIGVTNTGTFTADFTSGQTILTDTLPDTNITYNLTTTSISLSAPNSGTVDCSISSNDLTCTANGVVTLGIGGAFNVQLLATPSTISTFANPRGGGACQVDPNDNLHESNEGNNTCSDSVNVTDIPITGLSAANSSPTIVNTSTAFTASIASGTNVNYTWNFGDGNTGSGATSNHTYTSVGLYTAIITASNSANTVTATTQVTITDVPITGLSAANSSPTLVGGSTAFTATTTGGTNISYTWNFGDASTSSSNPANHTYASAGFYTAIVTASNSTNTVTATTAVTILTPIDVGILKLASASSVPIGGAVTYTLIYSNSGSITANNVVITDIVPITLTNVSYTSSGVAITPTVGITYVWQVGDLGPGAGGIITISGIADPSLSGLPIVITNTAMIDSASTDIVTANNSSTAVLTITDVTLSGLSAVNSSPTILGNPTAFTATITSGTHVTYQWDFGNGSTGSGSTTSYTYPVAGNYTATVTATNSASVLTATTFVRVDEPITGLSAANSSPTTLDQVTALTATVVTGNNITYQWDFGDGNTGSGNPITHIYPFAGTYTAIVTASNLVNVVTATTQVSITNLAPVANAGPDQSVLVSALVGLDGSASTDPDNHYPLTYGWTQTGGTGVVLSSNTISQPTFTAPSTPSILMFTLNVTDAHGLPNTIGDTVVITVSDVAISGLSVFNSSPTRLDDVTVFTATVSGGTNIVYTWNFGDGTGTSSSNPANHIYAAAGFYTAIVTATNGTNTLVATTPVTITNLAPIANAGPDQSVLVSASVGLDGSGSADPDNHYPLTYGWTQTGGASVVLSNNTISQPTFTAPSTPSILMFTLNVTDAHGLPNTIGDTVVITVSDVAISGLSASNSSPTRLDDVTAFTATVSGGSNIVYTWDFGDGTATSSSNPANHIYAAAGFYTAIVTATNDTNTLVASTPVTITNQAPVANAGPDQSVPVSASVGLDGSASTDPDNHTPLSYGWTQTGGPAVVLSSNTLSQPTFTAPGTPSILMFTLNVTDAHGLPNTIGDTVVITVSNVAISGLSAANSSPTRLDDVTTFTATVSAGTNIVYTWDFGDGTPTSSSNPANHIYAAAGFYTAIVTATNSINTQVATTPVTITNAAPVANAGPDQSVLINASVGLDGSASTDPDNHTPLTYGWMQTGGTPVVLSSDTVSQPTFTAPGTPSILMFTLNVTDAHGLPNTIGDTVVITVSDVAISGLSAVNDSPTRLDDVTSFTATISTGSNIVYTWNFGDGTATSSSNPTTHIYAAAGFYTAIVTATNGTNTLTASTPVTITNLSPIANAGPDQSVLVSASVGLDGSASYDPDNHTPLSYGWTQTGGTAVVLSSNTVSQPTFTAPSTPSILKFTLNVTDAHGLPNAIGDTVVITVSDVAISGLSAANSSPTRLDDVTAFTATVTGGTNIVYTWNFGDGTPTAPGSTVPHTYAAAGLYTAVVTATNGTNTLTVSTPVTITNLAPMANAGPDQSVLVNASVGLDGSGSSDPDNHYPLTYGWTQTSGTAVVLSSSTISQPTFTAPSIPSILKFTLNVTDAHGLPNAIGDTVVITVSDAAVTNLIATNSSPTNIGRSTLLTATANGTNIVYTWNFGDGSTGSGNLTAHTYPAVGSYVATVTATNSINTLTATTSVSITKARTFLPIITNNFIDAPDLIVSRLIASTHAVTVVIQNIGPAPVANAFWVDLYVDPQPVPTAVNQVWNDGRSSQGVVWGVTSSAFPSLMPGGKLTLTLSSPYYRSDISQLTGIPIGTPVYAQVDSANTSTTFGGVLETHEIGGQPYNNISGPIMSTLSNDGGSIASLNSLQLAIEQVLRFWSRLPNRPTP